jgi:hypothetical protein
MIKDFDKQFQDLIDEDIPRVMLSLEKREKEDNKETNNIFTKNYCLEY